MPFFFLCNYNSNECVEFTLHMVSLGYQFCQLIGPGLLTFGWSVILSALCILFLSADYQGV